MDCAGAQLNYPKVLDRKNKIVAKHSKGIEFLMRKNKVDVIKGTAKLLGGGRPRDFVTSPVAPWVQYSM